MNLAIFLASTFEYDPEEDCPPKTFTRKSDSIDGYVFMLSGMLIGTLVLFVPNTMTPIATDSFIILQEMQMTPMEVIASKGYTGEEYFLTTEDRYTLGIHRILPKNTLRHSTAAVPVLLVHNVFCDSAVWMDNIPEDSLAFILSEAGYDVWMMNRRGTKNSNTHKQWPTNDKKFCDFGLDQTATTDLAAVTDFVLNTSGSTKLFYLGHSIGTTEIFMLLSAKPEYNEKSLGFVALSPIANLAYTRSPFNLSVQHADEVTKFTSRLENHVYDWENLGTYVKEIILSFQTTGMPNTELVAPLVSWNKKNMNETRLPIYWTHRRQPICHRTFQQIIQIASNKDLRRYDFGSPSQNVRFYGKGIPPSYDLKLLSSPVALFSASNDIFYDARNIKWITDRVPNIVFNHVVNDSDFSQMDFLWNLNVRSLVYDHVTNVLNTMKHSKSTTASKTKKHINE